METFAALLAIYAVSSPVTVEFTAQRPVTKSFDIFLDLRLNRRLNKQSWGYRLIWYRAHYGVIVNTFSTVSRYRTRPYGKSSNDFSRQRRETPFTNMNQFLSQHG